MRLIKVDSILFDKYRITEQLDGGGQSFVYKADNLHVPSIKSLGRTVIIKQYSDLLKIEAQYPKVKMHFDLIRQKLGKNRNLICFPDEIKISEQHHSIIAVLPFIEGSLLSEKMREDLYHDERVRISLALVTAIAKLHEHGIAHLDLKPDNIIVKRQAKGIYIKLIDLDGSKIDGLGVRENTVKTIGYSSPEHFTNEETSISSDMFSIGVTLWELLFKKYPFPSKDNYLVGVQTEEIITGTVPLHSDIIQILIGCLSLYPEDRPSVNSVLTILKRHQANSFLVLKAANNDKNTGRYAIKITAVTAPKFARTYYENTTVSSSNLRGAGLSNLYGELFTFNFENNKVYIKFHLDATSMISMDGHTLSADKYYALGSIQEVTLGESKLVIQVSPFQ